MESLVEELAENGTLSDEGLRLLLESEDEALTGSLHRAAREAAVLHFSRQVKLRGLIEWSNVCRNDCLYCGIRRSNAYIGRYTLGREEILDCCERIWRSGVRTFVLQGGEQPSLAETLVDVVAEMRLSYPDAAITLSLGELPYSLYSSFRKAGADRYLLRHETADESHYSALHPRGMKLRSRLACLHELRRLGYETGMGMMIGSPFQTTGNLIADLRLMEAFHPDMIGAGPFIPQKDTPLGTYPAGAPSLTLKLYSIMRLMFPEANIPSTTALSALMPEGRTAGILSGANVLMPNFTPPARRGSYNLYDGKPDTDAAALLPRLKAELSAIGYTTI